MQTPVKANVIIKSSSKIKKRSQVKPEVVQSPIVINKHRGSLKEMKETNFLDKVDSQASKQHKPVSKSLGREKERFENKVKILEPQYENNLNERILIKKDFTKSLLKSNNTQNNIAPIWSRISESDLSNYANNYITLDGRNNKEVLISQSLKKRAEELSENRRKLYSSVQGVNLPKINMKNMAAESPSLRKSASYVTKCSCKILLYLINTAVHQMSNSIKDNSKLSSAWNDLDMISTILLPPEDIIHEDLRQVKMKNNPYFTLNQNLNRDVYKQGSMLSNYQQVVGNDNYRFLSERELLSSQYSSATSTIIPENRQIRRNDVSPSLKSMNWIKKNFIIRNVSNRKRGKGGKSVFPSDFFESS